MEPSNSTFTKKRPKQGGNLTCLAVGRPGKRVGSCSGRVGLQLPILTKVISIPYPRKSRVGLTCENLGSGRVGPI